MFARPNFLRHLLSFALAAIALASATSADEKEKGAIEGMVSPPGLRALVVARPVGQILGGAVITPEAGAVEADASGKYRLELEEGEYVIFVHSPGYVESREELQESRAAVKAGQVTQGPNFELVKAATIEGTVKGLERGAVVVAMRRAPVPREKRFSRHAVVAMDIGQYLITDLRPGVYDLLFVSSQIGLIDCRGSLLGEPDILSAADRRAIEDLNRSYARARLEGNTQAALAVISSSYSDVDKQTYETLKKRLEMLPEQAAMGRKWVACRSKILLLQGGRSRAMAVVHEVQQQALNNVKQPPIAIDLLVEYVKEGDRWRIRSIETIRDYVGLNSRIATLTGETCVLPTNYVAKYPSDPGLGCVLVSAGDKSKGHDFDLPRLLRSRG